MLNSLPKVAAKFPRGTRVRVAGSTVLATVECWVQVKRSLAWEARLSFDGPCEAFPWTSLHLDARSVALRVRKVSVPLPEGWRTDRPGLYPAR